MDNGLTTRLATIKQRPSLTHDSVGSTGCRYYRSLSQQNHNDADSLTVTPGMDYPAAKVHPVTETSHWLTGGLCYMRVSCQITAHDVFLLRKPGAAARPLS